MDELSAYLKLKYPDRYITGNECSNILLWGVVENSVHIPKLLTFNIGIDNYSDICRFDSESSSIKFFWRDNPEMNKLYQLAVSLSESATIPLFVILYPKLSAYKNRWNDSLQEYPLESVEFYLLHLTSDPKVAEKLNGEALRDKIYSALGKTFNGVGTTKRANHHLSDYFHYWSRSYLASSLVKFDIDGFIIMPDDHNVLIEIKRSSIPPIPNWRAHPNDKADYVLQNEFAKMINADFWLLHHESSGCDDSTIISFFDIDSIDDNSYRDYLCCNEVVLEMPLTGNGSLEEKIM